MIIKYSQDAVFYAGNPWATESLKLRGCNNEKNRFLSFICDNKMSDELLADGGSGPDEPVRVGQNPVVTLWMSSGFLIPFCTF